MPSPAVAPDWLRAIAPADWHERYDRRVEDMRLPEAGPKRDAYVVQVGRGRLPAARRAGRRGGARERGGPAGGRRAAPGVGAALRAGRGRIGRQREATAGGVRLRPAQGRGPGDRVESPYDAEARFRSKAGTSWTGYMVHLTETCDEDWPRLVVHADTTPANVHEAMRTAPIQDALAAKGLAPSEHLVDAGLRQRRAPRRGPREARHRPDRACAAGPELAEAGGGCRSRHRLRGGLGAPACALPRGPREHELGRVPGQGEPVGPTSGWASARPTAGACPSQAALHPGARAGGSACTRARSTRRSPPPGRGRTSRAGRRLYAQRQGIEGTISQGVRAFGLRRARYRGLAKTGLQNVATAAAINLDRLAAWLAGRPLAPTRTSRFAALAA